MSEGITPEEIAREHIESKTIQDPNSPDYKRFTLDAAQDIANNPEVQKKLSEKPDDDPDAIKKWSAGMETRTDTVVRDDTTRHVEQTLGLHSTPQERFGYVDATKNRKELKPINEDSGTHAVAEKASFAEYNNLLQNQYDQAQQRASVAETKGPFEINEDLMALEEEQARLQAREAEIREQIARLKGNQEEAIKKEVDQIPTAEQTIRGPEGFDSI